MLRICFTADDVARIRIAAEPDPLWETVFSIFRLRRPGPASTFGAWRRHAHRSIRRADLDMLLPLVRGGYYPDFLTPAEGAEGLPAALDALLSTPKRRLRTELLRLGGPQPFWMRRLAEGDPVVLRRLAGAVRAHHDAVVAPFWPQARADVAADRARRSRILADHGCEGLLNSFRPMMRWAPPVLEIDVTYDQTIELGGRGLRLVPAYLSWRTPDVLYDVSLPPVLVYPVEHAPHSSRRDTALATLLGRTRAALLEGVGDGQTTSHLAQLARVSPSAVSQHTAALRAAGLIRTTRMGKVVLHTLTPLGRGLLDQDGL